MNETTNESAPTLADAFSTLDYAPRGLYIQSVVHADVPAKPVPMLSRCLVNFLVNLGVAFYRTRGRYYSAMLFVHCDENRWTFQIPDQRCAESYSDWSLAATAPLENGGLLAGSFQMIRPGSSDDIKEMIPQYDGIHFVCEPDGDSCDVGIFLVAHGRHHPLHLEDVVYDETKVAVEHLAAITA